MPKTAEQFFADLEIESEPTVEDLSDAIGRGADQSQRRRKKKPSAPRRFRGSEAAFKMRDTKRRAREAEEQEDRRITRTTGGLKPGRGRLPLFEDPIGSLGRLGKQASAGAASTLSLGFLDDLISGKDPAAETDTPQTFDERARQRLDRASGGQPGVIGDPVTKEEKVARVIGQGAGGVGSYLALRSLLASSGLLQTGKTFQLGERFGQAVNRFGPKTTEFISDFAPGVAQAAGFQASEGKALGPLDLGIELALSSIPLVGVGARGLRRGVSRGLRGSVGDVLETGVKRSGLIPGEAPARGLADKAKPGGGGPNRIKEAFERKENYSRDLSDYSNTVYRETSVDGLFGYIEGSDRTPRELFFSNDVDLALGQGKSKGVILEFEAAGIRGQLNRGKPGAFSLAEQGKAEFRTVNHSPSDLGGKIRSITIKAGAEADPVRASRLRLTLNRLEGSGWKKTTGPDGSAVYKRPTAKPDIGASVDAGGAGIPDVPKTGKKTTLKFTARTAARLETLPEDIRQVAEDVLKKSDTTSIPELDAAAEQWIEANRGNAVQALLDPKLEANAVTNRAAVRLIEENEAIAIALDTVNPDAAASHWNTVIGLTQALGQQARGQGQALRALRGIGRLSPSGMTKYLEDVARKGGVDVPAGMRERVAKEAAKIKLMPDSRGKDIATAQLIQEIDEIIPPSRGSKISHVQRMAQLLNPKTFIRNIGGNSIYAMVKQLMSKPLAAGFDTVAALFTGKRSVVAPQLGAYARGAASGLKEGVEDAIGFQLKEFIENPAKAIDDLFGGKAPINTANLNTKYDIPQSRIFKGRVGTSLEKLLSLELRATDRMFWQAAYSESLANQKKAFAKGTAKLTPEIEATMMKVAHLDALKATFQDDTALATALTKIKSAMNLGAEFGGGDLVIKYPKTPGNLIVRGLEFSPAGFANVAIDLSRGSLTQKKLVETLADATVGTTALFGVGAALHRMGILSGKDDAPTNVRQLKADSGIRDFQLNVSALERLVSSGFDPEVATLQKGDNLVTYDWMQPLAVGLAMGAGYDAGLGDPGKSDIAAAMSIPVNVLGSIASTLEEQPLLQGISTIDTRDIPGSLRRVLVSVPASFQPSFVRQIAQIADNTRRGSQDPNLAKEAFNRSVAGTPAASESLPPQIGAFGEERQRMQGEPEGALGIAGRAANVFLNPSISSEYLPENDPLSDDRAFLLDLMEQTGETSHIPGFIGRKTGISRADAKKSIDRGSRTTASSPLTLSPDQQEAIGRYKGELFGQAAPVIRGMYESGQISAEQAQDSLASFNSESALAAKIELLGDERVNFDDDKESERELRIRGMMDRIGSTSSSRLQSVQSRVLENPVPDRQRDIEVQRLRKRAFDSAKGLSVGEQIPALIASAKKDGFQLSTRDLRDAGYSQQQIDQAVIGARRKRLSP